MIELKCGCLPDKAFPVGVGVISAKPSITMGNRKKLLAKGKVGSPVNKRYKKCLPKIGIVSAVGEGPLYKIKLDPLDIENCFTSGVVDNYGYTYNYDYCNTIDGRIDDEHLEFIVNQGSAEIEYRIGVEPSYFGEPLGGEKFWGFPDGPEKNHEKQFDLAYYISQLDVAPEFQTPKVLDSKLSKDGKTYAFAYLNMVGSDEIGVSQTPPQSCEEARRLPDWAVDDDLSFADEPSVPQVYVAIFKKKEKDGIVEWVLSYKIATGYTDYSDGDVKVLSGGLSISYDGNTVAVSNQEEDSIFTNNGRVKIWRYNSVDDNYVRIDQIGYDPRFKSTSNPTSYQRNYTEDKFKTPENFLIKREDEEVVSIGRTLFTFDEFQEVALEKSERYQKVFCTSTENFSASADNDLGVYIATDLRASDAFCALTENNSIVTWGDINLGGRFGIQKNTISSVKDVTPSEFGFSAVLLDGTIITWGGVNQTQFNPETNEFTSVSPESVDVIYANSNSYVALKSDNTAVPYSSEAGSKYGGSPYIFDGDELVTNSFVELSNISKVYATKGAYAAVKQDSSVVCWGNTTYGSDVNQNKFGNLNSVKHIYPRLNYFSAINNNGTISTWGVIDRVLENFNYNDLPNSEKEKVLNKNFKSIDPSQPDRTGTDHEYLSRYDVRVANFFQLEDQPQSSTDKKSKFTNIYSNAFASTALREDGFAVSWGDTLHGGRAYRDIFEITETDNTSAVVLSFSGNTFTIDNGFLPPLSDGGTYKYIRIYSDGGQYGDGDYEIISIDGATITVKNIDGSPANFETITNGGQSQLILLEVVNLNENVEENDYLSFTTETDLKSVSAVVPNYHAFTAIKTDGTVISWGLKGYGGDAPDFDLVEGETVTKLYSSVFAFAALTSTGRVIAWGHENFGGDIANNVASSSGDTSLSDAENPVLSVYSARLGFMAVRQDNSIVVWGNPDLNYGVGLVGPEAVGIYGKREHYGIGHSIDLDFRGESLVSGNRKKSYLNNAYTGSVKVFKRFVGESKWKRLGETILGSFTKNDGRISFGRTVKMNYAGNRIFSQENIQKIIAKPDGKFENEQKNTVAIFDYSQEDNIWQKIQNVELPKGHDPQIPFINGDYGLKINNYLAIDASGTTLAIGTACSGKFTGSDVNTNNGEVNIFKYSDEDKQFHANGRITQSPFIFLDDNVEVSGVSDNWTYSNLFGENVSLSKDGNKLLISSRDSINVYEPFTDGYGTSSWSQITKIDQYDNPTFPTFFNKDQDFSSPNRFLSAHMDEEGSTISTAFINVDAVQNRHYAHNVYKVDYTKEDERHDYDYLGESYISHFNSSIQKSGEYSQFVLTKDDILFNNNTPKKYGEYQSMAIGDRSTSAKMTFAFWSDVDERSTEDKIIRWGKYNINILSQPTQTGRDVKLKFTDTSTGFSHSFKKLSITSLQFDELFHFALLFDTEEKYLKLYIAGELHETFKSQNIQDFVVSTEKSYIGGFGLNSAQKKQILDDVRVFNRLLSRNEIFKLANHRKLAFRYDTYRYDINSAKGNEFELEFYDSTYLDIPIKEFCTNINYTDDCGRIIDSECILDAQLKFCFYTKRPRVTYTKTFGGSERPTYNNELSLDDVKVPVNPYEFIEEDTQTNINIFASNFFVVGDENPPRDLNQYLFVDGSFSKCFANLDLGPHSQLDMIGELISRRGTMEFNLSQTLNKAADISSRWLDKYHGNFVDWSATDILYPVGESGNNLFVNEQGRTNNQYLIDLYELSPSLISAQESGLLFLDNSNQPRLSGILFDSINEGVFVGGDYRSSQGSISDDSAGYIQASAVNTEFDGFCAFWLSDPITTPAESRLRIRLSGPKSNFESQISPKFYFSNIFLKNASGETVIRYEDFNFVGDSDQYLEDPGYTTYSLAPVLNTSTKYQWQDGYSNLDGPSGYMLTFDVRSEDRGNPYRPSAFDFGWAIDNDFQGGDEVFDTFYSVSGYNPTLRISAIEIYNSGRIVPFREDFVGFFVPGQKTGKRFERIIKPKEFLFNTFDTNIHPALSGLSNPSGWLWQDNSDVYTNEDCDGASKLLEIISNDSSGSWITSNHVYNDSGKLILRFGLDSSDDYYLYDPGQFDSAFGSMFNRWFDPIQKIYNKEDKEYKVQDSFFEFDSVVLRVLASKNTDARDYSLDIVGYSDDCIMNRTSRVGGFLQNVSGEFIYNYSTESIDEYYPQGTIPLSSGFSEINDLGISAESISDKIQYFESNSTNNDGGDHHALSNYPVVNSTDFRWYEIKLRAYDDDVELGRSRRHNFSTLLEKLYVDIYALPSGANIAGIELAVRHRPSAGLEMVTEGGEYVKIQDGRREGSFYPRPMGSSDLIFNAGSGYQPLSLIEDIPHAYTTPSTIKTNYARRWRGVDGIGLGAFNLKQFNYAYDRGRKLQRPLLSAWIDFSDITSNTLNSKFAWQNKSATLLENGSSATPEVYENFGARFRNQDMFSALAPGYSSSYRTADWTALSNGGSNYTNDVMYGKIADAYDRVARFGNKTTAEFSNVNPASGLSYFIRFIPDINATGVDQDNFYDKSTLIASTTQGSNTGIFVGYSGGYLLASGQNSYGDTASVIDSIPFNEYQYPLSVLVTYSEHADNKIRLYTDHEGWEGQFTNLRDTSDAISLDDYNETLRFGFAGNNNTSGLPMLVTEFGFSDGLETVSGANIVNENSSLTDKQITATQFFNNIRQKFFDPNESYANDTSMLWSYVDENTSPSPSAEWYLGAFRGCDFNWQFDSINNQALGKRSYTTERDDEIIFCISHDGTSYYDSVDSDIPSTIDSGVAYHTQIENDFLRLPLSDTLDSFHAIRKRVTKSLPRGYDFGENSLVVDTVYEHISSGEFTWDCNEQVGPKLIVSLYTRNQEPYYQTDEPNWGLINRKAHYISPSSCLEKFESKFTYQDYCDDSEQWALFPEETKLSEFNEKYFSKDVDEMFLQLDLVYPSGPAFTSELSIHAIHVRAEDAIIKPEPTSGTMNLLSSGNIVENSQLELYIPAVSGIEVSDPYIGFITSGVISTEINDEIYFLTSGSYPINESIGLLTLNKRSFNTSDGDSGDGYWQSNFDFDQFIVGDGVKGLQMLTSGGTPPVPVDASGSLSMLTEGIGVSTEQINLFINNQDFGLQSTGQLTLNVFASSLGSSGTRSEMVMNLYNDAESFESFGDINSSINFNISGVETLKRRFRSKESMSLFIVAPLETKIDAAMPLILDANPEPVEESGQIGLMLRNNGVNNYLPNIPGRLNFVWDGQNYGEGIDLNDEQYASIPANDEIRGVDLFGYGDCDSDSTDKAFDQQFITDDIVWREKVCNDAGIFRATNTYTNEDAGYEDQYYGIRKYTDLKPVRPYFVSMTIKTGDTTPIPVPREWEEWEYGICGVDTTQGECCTPDCDQSLNFSGIKLIADYPYLSGDASLASEFTLDSGRQEGDKYGFSSACHGDLIAVGAPFHKILDSGNELIEDAGAVFLYRRNEEEAGKKASWYLEEKLLMPEGTRRDYIAREYGTFITYPPNLSIGGNKWAIGQEGREFGHSVDVGSVDGKEVVVVGAPGAKWTRQFPEVTTSGIPVLMTIFTDKFTYNKTKLLNIRNTAKRYDLLYKYFSKPWGVDPDIWHPELDVHLLICQVYNSEDIDKLPNVPDYRKNRGAAPYWFNHVYINSLKDSSRSSDDLLTEGLDTVINKFNQIFPHNNNIYSGIPPIVGVFGDDTFSTHNKQSFLEILDGFVDYYEEYAYASGVRDMVADVPTRGYVEQIFDDAFVWNEATINLMNETLSTGNLIKTNNLKYITEGIGQEYARDDAGEFQMPPESGGRVFVFEKEFGEWNLVQEFVSPLEDYEPAYDDQNSDLIYAERNPVDRYGHSVGISENCNIISVGSPYSAEACQIFERDEDANTLMYNSVYDWLVETNDEYAYPLQDLIDRYNELIAGSGKIEVGTQVYKEMSKKDRFLLRKNKNIKLYDKIYKYHYTDIQYTGSFNIIPYEFAGTSRLGFSTSVSEDGKTVAFGAPTDSFNEFDDMNVWYGGVTGANYPENNTWASYTNAGAVRIFESRSYHSHNKTVEFYKFGNLDRSVNAENLANQGVVNAYEKLGSYFAVDNISFERTQFDEIEIPKDAGLAFIITPELDAASDEIIDNIKSWLALGDRTLVLVGNDPKWKQGGIYRKSNEIINKILRKLGSRMRITAARNQKESLIAGMSQSEILDGKFNVTLAHLPQYMHESDAIRENMYASGVADIKIDLSDLGLESLKLYSPCDPNNPELDRCIPPIQHSGDLRSEWASACFDKIEFYTNWAFHFDTANPGQSCKFYPQIVKPYVVRPDEEITPVLTAAEYVPQKSIIIPAASGEEEKCTTSLSGIIKTTITTGTTTYDFAEDHLNDLQFNLIDSGNQAVGTYTSFNRDKFANPQKENGRDAILQGVGTDYAGQSFLQTVKVADTSPYVTEELFEEEESSKVYLIASQLPENAWSMGARFGDEYDPRNNDQNIAFYNNLVMTDCSNRARIAQLGGWTGKTSFVDAFEDSVIKTSLENYNHIINTNVIYNEGSIIPDSVTVIWIANPEQAIPVNYVQPIKNWMKLGNKKLIITYNRDQQIATNVDLTLERFGMETRPFFLTNQAKYYVQDTEVLKNSALSSCCPVDAVGPDRLQILDESNPVIKGCDSGYKWTGMDLNNTISTKIDKLSAIPNTASPLTLNDSEVAGDPQSDGYDGYAYIPIKVGGSRTSVVVEMNDPVFDKVWSTPDTYWRIDGDASIQFPVIPTSGYRLFVDWISETDNELYDITFQIDGEDVSFSADPEGEGYSPDSPKDLGKTTKFISNRHAVDFRVKDGKNSITVKFDTNQWRTIKSEDIAGDRPYTPRILGVYGYPLPIIETYHETTKTKEKKIYITECSGVPWFTPEREITVPPLFRPISTNHVKYCDPDALICSEYDPELDVEDGPVIVADELEHFSDFSTGNRRSRIVLVTDSSMIQGFNDHYRYDVTSPNVRFIRSLYPESPDKSYFSSDQDALISKKGTKFEFTQKLRAPEKGSPSKYFANSGNQLLVEKFGQTGAAGQVENYTDQEDNFVLGDVFRRFSPFEKIKIDQEIERFGVDVVPEYGTYPRFSGNFYDDQVGEVNHWVDSNMNGGVSKFMERTGKDYLDYDVLYSGYPGDLFGFSVDIYKNKLVIGTPFNAYHDEDVVSWSGIIETYNAGDVGSGLNLSGRGGAGAAFYFERTGRGENAIKEFLPWEYKQKIKPSDSLNVGIDNATASDLTTLKGNHNLPDDFAQAFGWVPDMFGWSVSVESDFIAVGAPAHDYETLHNHIYSGSAAFIRKEFNYEFDIPTHEMYDLGDGTVRDQYPGSGQMVLNNGAVYTFRHDVDNYQDRNKTWNFAQKIVAQGFSDRNTELSATSGCENDMFGYSVALHQARRSDSDYVMIVGSPQHKFPTSGNHFSIEISGAGSAYTYDAMLRHQPNAIPSQESYIMPTVYGDTVGEQRYGSVSGLFYQNSEGSSITYRVSGIINTSPEGSIFLEVSGYDPADKGFVSQRPYVESIYGEYISGTETDDNLQMFTIGKPPEASAVMPLFVYNNDEGIVSSEVYRYLYDGEPVIINNSLGFVTSGIGGIEKSLKFRTKGK